MELQYSDSAKKTRSPEFLSSNFPEIPWREIVGMRNRIVHGYFDINAEIVIDTIRTGVPALQEVIKKAIELI